MALGQADETKSQVPVVWRWDVTVPTIPRASTMRQHFAFHMHQPWVHTGPGPTHTSLGSLTLLSAPSEPPFLVSLAPCLFHAIPEKPCLGSSIVAECFPGGAAQDGGSQIEDAGKRDRFLPLGGDVNQCANQYGDFYNH